MSPFQNGTNCRFFKMGRIVAFWNLGRIVAWDELSLGTNCRLGRIVAFWNLGRIVAWDESSLGTNCRFTNKICISIQNCHTRNKFKIEGVWFVFKSFCYNIFTNYSNIFGGGGNRKEPYISLLFSLFPFFFFVFVCSEVAWFDGSLKIFESECDHLTS